MPKVLTYEANAGAKYVKEGDAEVNSNGEPEDYQYVDVAGGWLASW